MNQKPFGAEPTIVIEMPATVFDCIKALSKSTDSTPMNDQQDADNIKISCDLETAHQWLATLVEGCPAAVPFIVNAIASVEM